MLDDYKKGSSMVIALKDQYQGMQHLLAVEEDQIKNKNREISELQNQLREYRVKGENMQSQRRHSTQEVNEFIFQLEKYANAQQNLSDETLATIDKYKLEMQSLALNNQRDALIKKRIQVE